jgi:hypothetical protein
MHLIVLCLCVCVCCVPLREDMKKAMSRYNFYLCVKCKRPYFGGMSLHPGLLRTTHSCNGHHNTCLYLHMHASLQIHDNTYRLGRAKGGGVESSKNRSQKNRDTGAGPSPNSKLSEEGYLFQDSHPAPVPALETFQPYVEVVCLKTRT